MKMSVVDHTSREIWTRKNSARLRYLGILYYIISKGKYKGLMRNGLATVSAEALSGAELLIGKLSSHLSPSTG